ncbi:3-oxoacyl-[acyl-carrier protein] reductase [Dissulfuribacter thermophilus]|uniref:3-oxoacyl-[acyl-carrier-protein] reductase n=1 Tax=Dissulfuribacter thermophilus TaxID=1156395 RepID=A0A1B9F814_9BACT|nr:3-oxoacyl-[acyl-carrier-protein] reductase [Dissulfuribacter thermophilus]OCC15911.1 3-oxoacyl-[acyl-carrier protein] reductase [Dissulfuribacter thermophilus]
MFDLKGKNALVTGGSRGIGRAISMALAKSGAKVFINYAKNEASALEVKEEIESLGNEAVIVGFDVGDRDAAAKAIGEIIESHGPIHILVNNAGITRDSLFMRMKAEDIDEVLRVNLIGAISCTKAVLQPMLKERWGRIINIGSVVGTMGNIGQANYCASKAGLEGFTKAVAREVATRGITCNVIAPGFIETDMTSGLSEKIKDSILSQIPMGRMGSPEDVANACVFLASPEASYITGHVLHVNGGMLCA